MAWTTLPFAEWAPDQPPKHGVEAAPGAVAIINVIPRTPTTYGPMPSAASAYSGALSGRCLGSYTTKDSGRNVLVFAGDQTKLYLLRAGSTNFADVSGSTYAGQPWPDTFWSFTAFGLRVIACNYYDDTQTYLIESDSLFSDLSASAPRAKFCEAVGDFIMLGNTFDGTNGIQRQRVWWSAIGDPTSWPTPGTTAAIQVQSDYQDLQQTDLGEITGLAAGPIPMPGGCVTIFCEKGIYFGSFVGSPAIFSFKSIENAPGCIAPRSIVKGHINSGGAVVPVIYYVGADGFYAFDGTKSIAIGANKFDRFVLTSDAHSQLLKSIQATVSPANKLIFFAYSSGFSSGSYDRMIAYNWDINRASYIDLTGAAIEGIGATATIGYTLDELDPFGTIDTLPYSLDSEVWVGGLVRLGVFNSSHQLAYLTGNNMAPTVETPEVEAIPGKRVFIRNVRPIVDATGGSVSMVVRERQSDAVTAQTAVAMNAMGECPQRRTGRYVRARVTFPSNTNFTHLSGVELDLVPQGVR